MIDLPRDIDAERQVIGAAMHDPSVIDDLSRLRPEDFYTPQHEQLWRLLLRQHINGDPTSPVALIDALRRDPIRGLDASALHKLYEEVITPSSAAYYAESVTLRARQRRMIEAGTRIAQIAASVEATTADLDQAADNARRELETVDERPDSLGLIGDEIDETLDLLDKPAPVTPTPWESLNHVIGGWSPGRLYVVGARPAVGKSIMAIQAATAVARAGKMAAMLSLEMSTTEIHKRVISNIAAVPYERLESHTLGDRDWDKVAAGRRELSTMPLAIKDDPAMTMHQTRAWLRKLAKVTPLGLVIVDYLQLIDKPRTGRGNHSRQEDVAGFSRALKLLSKELNVPVLALSQLNRASEQRSDKLPSLADLRESGAVEQDADTVVLLHRDLDDPSKRTRLGVAVAKSRHSTTGNFALDFEGHYMRAVDPKWTPSRSVA